MQSAFVGAIAIGDLIKSTLGPKGMVSMRGFGCCVDYVIMMSLGQGAGI